MRTEKLGTLVSITGGGTPDRSNALFWSGKIPWVTVKDFKSLKIEGALEHITVDGLRSSASNLIPAGAIIVPTRMALGKAAISTTPVAINQDLKALQVLDAELVDRDFLFRFLLSKASYFESRGKGATVKGITLDVLRDLDVPLPSKSEQQRIARIFENADGLRRKRHEAIYLAGEFVQATFFHSFGDVDTNERAWPIVRLEEIALQVTDGEHQTPKRSSEGVYLLSARNIQNGFLALQDVDYVPQEEFERIRRRCEPKRGDILISCSGSIGRVAQVATDDPLALVRSVALVRADTTKIRSCFLEHLLRSASMQRRMVAASKSSAQANLFQGPIRALPVMLPPIEDQIRFESIVAQVMSLNQKSAAASAELIALTKSLQSNLLQQIVAP